MVTKPKRTVILGVTGGIAAYKSADLVRKLVAADFSVHVVMTKSAQAFITPLTFQALSTHPVHTDLLDTTAEAAMGHIALARLADLILIAPASANTLANMAQGHASDLLTTLVLASKAPVVVAPAMNVNMWSHPATQSNMAILKSRHIAIWGPDSGDLACGDIGEGRMLEPDALLSRVQDQFAPPLFAGKHITITAGPTQEPIDPARLITNHSSGKMGYALAEQALLLGATVTLISGPVALSAPQGATVIPVKTADDMYDAAMKHAKKSDIFIGVAAVADYKVAEVAKQKLKKQQQSMTLTLIQNKDIIADVAKLKTKLGKPFVVGFAAETENLAGYGQQKLKEKALDMIAINHIGKTGIGFNADDNALLVLHKQGEQTLEKAPKPDIARRLLTMIHQCEH